MLVLLCCSSLMIVFLHRLFLGEHISHVNQLERAGPIFQTHFWHAFIFVIERNIQKTIDKNY
jgi:hypothetical protein